MPLSASGSNFCRALNANYLQSALRTAVSYFTGFFGVSAQPGAGQLTLLGDSASNTTVRFLRIGDTGASDTKLRVYTGGGALVATSTSQISTTGLTEITVCVDCVSFATVLVTIWVAGVVETFVDTGVSPATFWSNGAGVLYWGSIITSGQGADLFGDDFLMRHSTSASFAPHLHQFIRPHVFGGEQFTPTQDGNYVEWAPSTALSAHYLMVAAAADSGTHDSDATYMQANAVNLRDLYQWGNGGVFPQPITDTDIDAVYFTMADRLAGGGKTDSNFLVRLGGTDLVVSRDNAPSTSYVGVFGPTLHDADRPGGGAYTLTDFGVTAGRSNMQWGMQAVNAGTPLVNVTKLPGPTVVGFTNRLQYAPYKSLVIPRRSRKHLVVR